MKNSSSRTVSPRPLIGLLLGALLAASAGACEVSVEADVPDVEVTQHGIAFGATPPTNGAGGDVSTDITFEQSRPVNLPKDFDSSVQAVQVDLIAKTGITNFDFLRVLRITMSPKGSTDAPVELVNYEKADGVTVGSTLTITSKNPVNILDQWKADSALFDVQVAGTLPEQAWTIDMAVHFAGKITYKY